MTDRAMHHGRLITPARRNLMRRLLIGPGAGWLLFWLAAPMLLILGIAFMGRDGDGRIVWSFTPQNLQRLFGFGSFGWSADVLWIFWRSIWIATLTTLTCLLLAYPIAFRMARCRAWERRLWFAALVIPMATNLVVRTYAWELLLSSRLPPARLAAWLGWIEPDRALYPSLIAVLVAMVSNALPFAILPIYTAVARMDLNIVDAAADLYANPWRQFRHAILPQTWHGATAAIVLTFVPAMGMFVISDRLGGGRFMLVGNLIQQQFGASRDYPYGAMISSVLVILTLLALWALRRQSRHVEVF